MWKPCEYFLTSQTQPYNSPGSLPNAPHCGHRLWPRRKTNFPRNLPSQSDPPNTDCRGGHPKNRYHNVVLTICIHRDDVRPWDPAQTFRHFMDEMFRGLNFCVCYVDILVASESIAQHLDHLPTILQQLTKYGLVINVTKCPSRTTVFWSSNQRTGNPTIDVWLVYSPYEGSLLWVLHMAYKKTKRMWRPL